MDPVTGGMGGTMAATARGRFAKARNLVGERTELAIVDKVVSPEQLRYALKRERAVSTLKLGARLLELRLITQDQLHGDSRVQNNDARRHLGEILLDLGSSPKATCTRFFAKSSAFR